MIRFLKFGMVLVCMGLSSGCAVLTNGSNVESERRAAGIEQERLALTREMRAELVDMARSVEHSTRVLAEVRNAESALSMNRPAMEQLEWNSSQVPDGMGIPMTMSQTGHPEPFIEMIASVTGYTYRRIGTPGAGVQAVRIEETSTAHQILRSVSTQMGPSVLVQVIPSNREILVNWHHGRDRLAGGVE